MEERVKGRREGSKERGRKSPREGKWRRKCRKSSSSPWGSPERKGVLWPGWVSQAGSVSCQRWVPQKPGPGPRPTAEVHRGGVQP